MQYANQKVLDIFQLVEGQQKGFSCPQQQQQQQQLNISCHHLLSDVLIGDRHIVTANTGHSRQTLPSTRGLHNLQLSSI